MRVYILKIVLGLLIVVSPAFAFGSRSAFAATQDDAPPVLSTYPEILTLISQGEVQEASFLKEQNIVIVTLNNGTLIQTYYPASKGPSIVVTLLESGTPIRLLPDSLLNALDSTSPESSLVAEPQAPAEGQVGFGTFIIGLIAVGGFVMFIVLQNKRTKRKDEQATKTLVASGLSTTTFADVAGCEEAIDDLRELVEFLKDSERFAKLGAKIPKGALLVGPPGTGKTLLAKAVAGEANVPFIPATGSDFVEMYVGVGAKRIRELFAKANEHGKAIIFIDEIDAIGRARADQVQSSSGANIEHESTLLALLSELDGFKESGVIVIGATNRPDVLDPALVRPGRLERKVQVPNPDRRGREQILMVHTSDKPLGKDVDLGTVALRTPGSSGADLAAIANEAAIEAARRNLDEIDQDCFENAISTIIMGRARPSALVTDQDRKITAWHEAGHALVALLEQEADNPLSVSITPRGAAGGVTWMSGTDDHFLSRNKAKTQLVVALGGRAGEELLMNGEFTQGAQSDLITATKLAGAMVTRFGMTRRGLQVRQKYDGTFDATCEDVVDELLEEAMNRARTILSKNHEHLKTLALGLLEHDTLTLAEIRVLLDGGQLVTKYKAAKVLQKPRKLLPKKIMEDRAPVADSKTRKVKQKIALTSKLVHSLGRKPKAKPETA